MALHWGDEMDVDMPNETDVANNKPLTLMVKGQNDLFLNLGKT